MTVIPAIDAKTFEEAKTQCAKVKDFAEWIHIDVVDGKFAPNVTWGNPNELKQLIASYGLSTTKFEIHLMVEHPEFEVEEWVASGAKRIIVHVEAMEDAEVMQDACEEKGVTLMLAANPETPVENLLEHMGEFTAFHVLAVTPGMAGQVFQESVLQKISVLRQKMPHAIIEVDGGMNPETGKLVKNAGADVLVSTSYILNNANPKKAFEELSAI